MNKLHDSDGITNEITTEENKIPVAPEGLSEESLETSESLPDAIEPSEIDGLDKAQLVEKLSEIVTLDVNDAIKNAVESLKQAFYKLKRVETEAAQKEFVDAGGLEAEFQSEIDETEEKLKELLAIFREKKALVTAKAEKIKENNLAAKKEIIEKLKELIDSKSDFYKVYNEFRKLQQQWKEIKQVPQTAANDLWKEYQHYSEKFYDLLKINNEMRDYDFKKNMELKQTLCEAVEKLENEVDAISAFYQLQNLHQEWREIGPVARELREEIWSRFKKASTVINKKHQEHFESLRSLEQRNLEEKISICEEMENIDLSKITNFKEWDEQNKQVLELQEKWKTIGFAPKKSNVKIFERFRIACDAYFHAKNNFYKNVKESMEDNLEKKKALCEKAEALKDSTEWKETTDKLIALQKEWKSTGPVSRKYSDALWKRFVGACDSFFEQKNEHFSSQKSGEIENLKKKKGIISKINDIDTNLPSNEAVAIIRELTNEWNHIGFVPFREKDKIHNEYRAAVDKHFDRLKIDDSERRLQTFKSNLNEISSGGEKSKNKLLNEREKLMRTFERLKGDIQTYENNIGFLSVSSKGGGGLVKEMNRKIDSLKEELNLIVKKIEVIDVNFDSK
jgi:DNA repair exonuclease SbcCD ATPase subunit